MKIYKGANEFLIVKLKEEIALLDKEIKKQELVTNFNYGKKIEELSSLNGKANEFIRKHNNKEIDTATFLKEIDKLDKQDKKIRREIKKRSAIDIIKELDIEHELKHYRDTLTTKMKTLEYEREKK